MYVTNPDVLPIDGLSYIPNFITDSEQEKILKILDSNPYSSAIHRRQQFYGTQYYHTTHDLQAIQPYDISKQELVLPLTPLQWLIDRTCVITDAFESESEFPNQCLVNEYVQNQGISSHFEDYKAFGGTIITISLNDPVYMTLKKPREIGSNQCQDLVGETKVLLEPRSCLVMKGECRYQWRHGITKAKLVELPDGSVVRRGENYRRVSLTIRRVLDGRKKVDKDTVGRIVFDK